MRSKPNLRKRPEKKSESLEVRLPYSVKTNFMEKCIEDGDTASHVLRGFIASYLHTKPSNSHIVKYAPLAMIMPILLVGLYIHRLKNSPSLKHSPAQRVAFSSLDSNSDGFLTATDARNETRPALFSLLEHADKNEDGRLSEDEMYTLPTAIIATDMQASGNKDDANQAQYLTLNVSEGIDIDTQLKQIQAAANLSDSALADLAQQLKTSTLK